MTGNPANVTPPFDRARHILFVGQLPPHQTGAAIVNGALVSHLCARGYRVQALATGTPWRPGAPGDQLSHSNLRLHQVELANYRHSFNDPSAGRHPESLARELAGYLPRMLGEQEPDLLLVGDEESALALPAYRAACDAVSVAILHGTIGFSKFDPATTDTVKRILAAVTNADCVVSVSRHVAEELRGTGIPEPVVIANGVDVSRFRPSPLQNPLRRQLGLADDDIVVLHASNLKPIKRPLDIVEAASRALPRNARLRFVILGDLYGRDDMETACRNRDVADRFCFPGWVPHQSMPGYLDLADIVVMPSAVEALSLVYLETQACARTLLASDIAASREVVVDGETGVLFPVGDVEALARQIVRLADDDALRARLGERARVQVVASHNLVTTLARYEALIADLLSVAAT